MTDVTFGMVSDEPGIGVVVDGAVWLYFIGGNALLVIVFAVLAFGGSRVSRPIGKRWSHRKQCGDQHQGGRSITCSHSHKNIPFEILTKNRFDSRRKRVSGAPRVVTRRSIVHQL